MKQFVARVHACYITEHDNEDGEPRVSLWLDLDGQKYAICWPVGYLLDRAGVMDHAAPAGRAYAIIDEAGRAISASTAVN